jgi:hypothetical protein
MWADDGQFVRIGGPECHSGSRAPEHQFSTGIGPEKWGGFTGSMQHWLGVYTLECEIPRFPWAAY